jgi:glycosyltransferase involved in cell wall biosynthesis
MKYDSLVSVIIPTYNRYELLLNCIRSVLNQTYTNFEIIVINDNSTDKRYYSGVLEKFPKTRVIHLDINQREKYKKTYAQGKVREYGIKIALGEWIAFLDDDDFFLENKLEVQLKKMKESGSLFSTTNTRIIKHNKILEDKLDINIGFAFYDKYNLPKFITLDMMKKINFVNCSTVIIHKSLIEKTGEFKIIQSEDWDYWKRVMRYENCLYVEIPLTYITIGNTKFYRNIN